MKLDINKLSPIPKDQWEAIDHMNRFSQNLVSAIFILQSFVEFNDEPTNNINIERAKKFIDQFEESKTINQS